MRSSLRRTERGAVGVGVGGLLLERDGRLRGDLLADEGLVGLDGLNHLQHQLMGVTNDLLLVIVVGERNRGLTVAEGDAAAVLDLLQGLRLLSNGGSRTGSQDSCNEGELFHAYVSSQGKPPPAP